MRHVKSFPMCCSLYIRMHHKNIENNTAKPMSKEKDISLSALALLTELERSDMKRYACYRLGNIDDAEDVLQDTFLKVYSRISNLKSAKISDLRHYLFRALSNTCTSKIEERRRWPTMTLGAEYDIAEGESRNFESDFQRISLLMQKIPEEQAEVIRLRIYGNNSFLEISEILSIPVPTVKSRFLYGLEKIRKGIKVEQ